jgi:hypothetical protein
MSMLCSTHRRVHVCPIKALAAVSAEVRALLPERFRSHFLGGGAPFTLGTEAPLYQTCLCRSGSLNSPNSDIGLFYAESGFFDGKNLDF